MASLLFLRCCSRRPVIMPMLSRQRIWTLKYAATCEDEIEWEYEYDDCSNLTAVEIWHVSDIVSNIQSHEPKALPNDVLLNPANPSLVGTALPYFPVGGPVPADYAAADDDASRSHSIWGGMEAGPLMHYPTQAIDGRVHVECGPGLKQLCTALPINANGQRLTVGRAMVTEAEGRLLEDYNYQYIIHTAPPLAKQHYLQEHSLVNSSAYDKEQPHEMLLLDCYNSCMQIFLHHSGMRSMATALVGAGTAGNDINTCVSALVSSIKQHMHPKLNLFKIDHKISNKQKPVMSDDGVKMKVLRICLQQEGPIERLISEFKKISP